MLSRTAFFKAAQLSAPRYIREARLVCAVPQRRQASLASFFRTPKGAQLIADRAVIDRLDGVDPLRTLPLSFSPFSLNGSQTRRTEGL
jgi:hypothetical protein